MKNLIIASFCLLAANCLGQTRALFLGNSYTYYNDMPIMVVSLAENAGEELIVDTHTPGGSTFSTQSTNTTTLSKIEEGSWDYVILQEQSQLPAFSEAQFMDQSYPFASSLNDHIIEFNPCAETMFYMTWGGENGDEDNCDVWPPVCTYEGMDDLLAERYQLMAEDFEGVTSPVGKVWRHIRENNPEIQLYANDGSHPSLAGSYAAAVCFYTAIFRNNPLELTEYAGVTQVQAEAIQTAVFEVVYSDLNEHLIGTYDLTSEFEVEVIPEESTMNFTNLSENADEYIWLINGQEYDTEDVSIELTGGIDDATVVLTSINDCGTISSEEMVFDFINSVEESKQTEVIVYPNPSFEWLYFTTELKEVTIYDTWSRHVMTEKGSISELNIELLPIGSYSVHFISEGKKMVKQIIKE